MNILVFAASHRPTSSNRKLARLSADWLNVHEAKVDFAEYVELDTPLYNAQQSEEGNIPESVRRIAARVAQADALVIAAPEYNWSVPGSLKNLIDWLSHLSPCPLKDKTALLMCATPSKRGGAVGLSHLKTTLESVGVYVYPPALTCGEAEKVLGTDTILDGKTRDRFETLHTGFLDYATRLLPKAA
jgi:NAD(P)H-dependent FMN reductase